MQNSELIQLFLQLVQIDSPTGEESGVREFIIQYLKKLGIDSTVDEYGNLLARTSGDGAPLLLSAHMDTVEPGRGIKPHITDEGYIVSDGTTILGADNKVGIATILTLVDQLTTIPHRPLEVLFTVSEEVGTGGASKFNHSSLKSIEGYCFDLAQPLGYIVVAAPFYEHIEVSLTGVAAHSSRPRLGRNILPALGKLLSLMHFGEIESDTYVNIGTVIAGDAINTVPASANLHGDIRALTQEALDRANQFIALQCKHVMSETGIEILFSWEVENPGYRHDSPKAQLFIERTKSAIESIGLIPEVVEMGVSDANQLNAHGISVLELSSGEENAHTTDERIKIANLEKLLELAIQLVAPSNTLQTEIK